MPYRHKEMDSLGLACGIFLLKSSFIRGEVVWSFSDLVDRSRILHLDMKRQALSI